MESIKMVDAQLQYQRHKKEINQVVSQVLESGEYINGVENKLLATELASYLEVSEAIPCANGSDALLLALMALELNPGDEVITTSFSFIAAAEAIKRLQLTPVFIDVDPHTFNMNPSLIEKAITKNTKAIIAVHMFGQGCDMNRMMTMANNYELKVIEDNSQAFGANYLWNNKGPQKMGSFGDISTTSFNSSGTLNALGDGGACFTNNPEYAKKIIALKNHGSSTNNRYDHIGISSNLDCIQAAVLRLKLKYIDETIGRRIALANFYDDAFSKNEKIITPFTLPKVNHVYQNYTLKLFDVKRNKLQQFMQKKGIETSIHYPTPIHKQPAYKSHRQEDLPITEALSDVVMSIPIHPEISTKQQTYIAESLLNFVDS